MKVLGIVGSARKGGNTEILIKEALAAAQEAGAETEIVLVNGKNIAPCDGCSSCFKTGVCRIQDDMQEIYGQMEKADAILFGSPVYFGSVSAQLKAIMDRTFMYLPAHRLEGKVAAPILAVRRVGAGGTRNLLLGYFMTHKMMPVRGSIGYGRQRGEVMEGPGGDINSTSNYWTSIFHSLYYTFP